MTGVPLRVVFVAGYGRMGSTLLDRMLGEVPGFCSVGELRHIWVRGLMADQLCGCGQPFRSCPFWAEVMGRSFGGVGAVDARRLRALQRELDHVWRIPVMRSPVRTPGFARRLAEYGSALERVYRAAADVSGASFLVDSSKAASHAFLLSTVPDVELHVVHLVRDSRAVAYSWQRVRLRPEVHWRAQLLPRYGPVRSSVEWDAMNLSAEATRWIARDYCRLRYEDLVSDPRATVARILEALGRTGEDLSFVGSDRVTLGPAHTVSGNPSRFDQGEVPIRADVEWTRSMKPADRRVVEALTWPLLVRYGYR